jgi:hypothetical protein
MDKGSNDKSMEIAYIMRRIITVLIFFASLVLSFFIFSDYTLMLISLKEENIKKTGFITKLQTDGFEGELLRIEYYYDHMGKRYNDKIKVSSSKNYYIGQRISVLISPDNSISYLEREINSRILERILVLLSFPLLITFLVGIPLYSKISSKEDKEIKSKKNKMSYKYYVQQKNHKIKETIIGQKIELDDIIENIDYDALENDNIICCGIEKNNDFVEISFSKDEYELRIFKNGDERIEIIKTVDDYSIINETIYKNII